MSLSDPKGETPTTNEDDDDVYLPESNINNIEGEPNEAPEEDLSENAPSRYVQNNHPESQILG